MAKLCRLHICASNGIARPYTCPRSSDPQAIRTSRRGVWCVMKDSRSAQTVRARIRSLMHKSRWNQSETARRLKKIRTVWDQPRFNRILRGQQPATIDDIDDLARVFSVTPTEMLMDAFGQLDRRTGKERRSGIERRQKQETIWTPVDRAHWPAVFKKKA